jgi:orotate phosphoribosyltransferase
VALPGKGASRQSPEKLLRQAGALLEGHFQLASGKHSSLYVEKFRLLERPPQTEELCRMIAGWSRGLSPQLVAAPTTGGIIVSYEVARLLGLRGIFAEVPASGGDGGRSFQRGFTVGPGERTLVVDDVLTTGGSVRDVLEAVRAAGGQPAGVAVLIDRSGGQADFGLPFFACLTLDLPAYDPGACPLCASGAPLTIT